MIRRKRWTVVAFKHPYEKKSVFYRQNVVDLLHAVAQAVAAGANLMSIRGFEDLGFVEKYEEQVKYPLPEEIQQVLEVSGFENVEVKEIG